ncbi:AMP-binding protein [Micromonospora sp. LOL_024]|uniref:AMP-binding protein n=1 Tax=Micromonospora sp. LOL_024 TaxID=3345412 RepID=UPI003A854EE6
MTYAERLDRSTRLARAMRTGLGVQPGDRVAVLCRNHPDLIGTVVFVRYLPRNATGKVLTRELRRYHG